MQPNKLKKELFTIPNFLSLFRLLLIPVYMSIYLTADCSADYYLAAIVLSLSCLTDMIDGKIARKFNMISNFGKILDPLADKLTQFMLIVCLSVKHPILIALIVLFIIKEGFQLIAGSIYLTKGIMLKGALFTGKLCTCVLFLSLILLVMMPQIPYLCVVVLTAIDSVCMAVSFVDYCIAYSKQENHFQPINSDQ